MSILLTAVKKKTQQPKPITPSPQNSSVLMRAVAAHQQPPQNPGPPLSNERTAIWHWRQGDTMTTVMLPRDTLQLWCNGVTADASSMLRDGDFAFEIRQSGASKGLNARLLAIREPGGVTFNLYVDGKLIPEHTAPSGGGK